MQQQDAVNLGDSPLGHFFVGPVQRVSGLKRNYVCVSNSFKFPAHFRWRQAKFIEIVAGRKLQHPQPARYIELPPTLHLCHQGVFGILSAKDALRGFGYVPVIDFFNAQDGEQLVLGTAQGQVAVQAKLWTRIDGQRQRNWKDVAAR